MNRISLLAILLVSPFLYTSYPVNPLPAAEITGTVTNARTGKALENVYLYITEGEEEAVTNSKGRFKITTWRKAPLVLTVQHPGYEKQRLKISSLPTSLSIGLIKN
jgi:hypothetical protein